MKKKRDLDSATISTYIPTDYLTTKLLWTNAAESAVKSKLKKTAAKPTDNDRMTGQPRI